MISINLISKAVVPKTVISLVSNHLFLQFEAAQKFSIVCMSKILSFIEYQNLISLYVATYLNITTCINYLIVFHKCLKAGVGNCTVHLLFQVTTQFSIKSTITFLRFRVRSCLKFSSEIQFDIPISTLGDFLNSSWLHYCTQKF